MIPPGETRDSRNLALMAPEHYKGAEGFGAWEKGQPSTQKLASLSTDCTRHWAESLGPHSLLESLEELWGTGEHCYGPSAPVENTGHRRAQRLA